MEEFEFEVTELSIPEEESIVKKSTYKKGLEYFLSTLSDFKKEKFKNIKLMNQRVSFTCPIHGEVTQQKVGFVSYEEGCRHCKADTVRFSKFKILKVKIKKAVPEMTLIFNKSFPKFVTYRVDGQKFKLLNRIFFENFVPKEDPVSSREIKPKYNLAEIIDKAIKIHGGKFTYPESANEDVRLVLDELTIICPKHGAFKQTVSNHLRDPEKYTNKGGCKECFKDYRREYMKNKKKEKDDTKSKEKDNS